MSRQTIDYGIDLGTTNSTIAVLDGTTVDVVSDVHGAVITPSAIWYDKRGKLHVGAEARRRTFEDPDNGAVEFKLNMGQQWHKTIERTGQKLLPEEMSAEILKELKNQVRTKRREEIDAAVITVPAAFDIPQCEATRRAAKLAGLEVSPLLQEPVAAALAYGFQSSADGVFWMVYDFGGGTFDAAIIQVQDGMIQVVNHAGDNRLGGKNIDWDIVDKIVVPHLLKERRLSNFSRNDLNWKSAFAKLKVKAEEAKITVSTTGRPAEIFVEDLCEDDRGDAVDCICELSPQDLEQITRPWISQSLNLCTRALSEKNLSGQALEKLIVVGGSSLFPWLQQEVSESLGVRLESAIDPITVVARGAAVFAGTQRLDAGVREASQVGVYRVQLEYEPVGTEANPLVGGRVTAPSSENLAGLSVVISEKRSQWRSGVIRLASDGVFATEVLAEPGRRCEYELTLLDSAGRRLPCQPDRFTYTMGMAITSPPLTHHLGVAMANNKPYWLLRKGAQLPARGRVSFATTTALHRKEPAGEQNIIRVPVIEGEVDTKADRNVAIGFLEILPTDPKVKRDVPLGSEIEVTIEIDESRTTRAQVYIPILDEWFEHVFRARHVLKAPEQLQAELNDELERLATLRQKNSVMDAAPAQSALDRLDETEVVESVTHHVAAAAGDREEQAHADRKLTSLKAEIDAVEEALEWPTAVQDATRQLSAAREVVDSHGDSREKARLRSLESEIARATSEHKIDLLRSRGEEVFDLGASVALRQPAIWVAHLEYLRERRHLMRDGSIADRLFAQALRAIQGQDFDGLKAAVRQLIALLPPDEQESAQRIGGFRGTIIARHAGS